MFDWLKTLYVEQATADEVVTFLLLGGAIALAVAFLIYALVLVLFWRWRRQGEGSLRELLFPSRATLRRHASEYLVAGSTALLLVFSVAARHQVVQAVLSRPVDTLEAEEVHRVFPLGPPTREKLVAAGLPDSTAGALATALADSAGAADRATPTEAARLTVEPLLRSLLQAGLPENADVLLNAAVTAAGGRLHPPFPTREHLLVVAALMLLGYASWFGWKRGGATGPLEDPDYGELFRRLSVPAVCVPLLLVSAAGTGDAERVKRSAAAVAARPTGGDGAGTGWVRTVIRSQVAEREREPPPERLLADIGRLEDRTDRLREGLAELRTALRTTRRETEALGEIAARLRDRLETDSAFARGEREALRGDLDALGEELDALATDVAAVDDRFDALDRDVRRRIALGEERLSGLLDERVAELRTTIDRVRGELDRLAARLPDTGLLLVSLPARTSYRVRAGSSSGAVRDSGRHVGLHELDPGVYVVTAGQGVQSTRVVIRRGEAATVWPRRAFVVE